MDDCAICGFSYRDHPAPGVVAELVTAGHDFAGHLRMLATDHRFAPLLARRSVPERWSALEYACHLRDVLLIQRDRVIAALMQDDPAVAPMHRDQRPELAGYRSERPERVALHLEVATDLFTAVLEHLDDDRWRRPCTYNHPTPRKVDVAWVAVHTLHECVHHHADVDGVLEGIAASSADPGGRP